MRCPALFACCLAFFFTLSGQQKPLVVFVCGDHEYSGEQTLPLLAEALEARYGIRTLVLRSAPDQNGEKDIPGLEALKSADLAVFFLRWRQLPTDQLAQIEAYLTSAKPLIGLRTTTHGFNFPPGHPSRRWNDFGEFALNAPPGWGGKAGHTHYGHESSTDVTIVSQAADHPILKGVDAAFHVRSWLYRVQPDYPLAGSQWLLQGKAVNPDKVATVNPVAWTGTNAYGGRLFMTTLGHPEDFAVESFQRLMVNAVLWQLAIRPKKWRGKLPIAVPYRGIVASRP